MIKKFTEPRLVTVDDVIDTEVYCDVCGKEPKYKKIRRTKKDRERNARACEYFDIHRDYFCECGDGYDTTESKQICKDCILTYLEETLFKYKLNEIRITPKVLYRYDDCYETSDNSLEYLAKKKYNLL